MAVIADPVLAVMKSVAARLNAVVISDAPDKKEEDYRIANGSERVYIVSPKAKEPDGDKFIDIAASAHAAGIFASINFWESP
ncbi:MAG: hypothetical protein EOP04_15280, partial [Proteobacteria bacterium]